ncbi:lasso RiPP family leader peptide-containing protein [Streptomyces sp. 4503]|uniref:Lasso RiPP family leader peptide-containing protein n=1 Tax=Streptomyces niphimycinicus TaxID=2842201 RepID=A0ABS6CHB7_9ACTN|nr:lasso RiPP family leader peptide-containing protein [Streptomyces niphimycinicus]MBU3866316.1 lasso RiPP family leader peptide-containing protein [Streptomyces niphimycinicus]
MVTEQLGYEPPMLVEVGEFADLTRFGCCGRWIDNPFGYGWFDF